MQGTIASQWIFNRWTDRVSAAVNEPILTPPTGALDPDSQLMLKVGQGDSDAFNSLMSKYQKTVLNLIYRFLGCSSDQAQDLAQEVFIRIYRSSERYQAKARFFTYVYTVTLNLCRNARLRNSKRQMVSLDEEKEDAPSLQIPDPSGSAADSLDRVELAEVIRKAISDLPEEQRELVILQRYQGLAYEEICEMTGQSLSAVKSKLHRAKITLKKKLEPYLNQDQVEVTRS